MRVAHRPSLCAAHRLRSRAGARAEPFTYQEVMIPVRDGVHLQTVILTPVDQTGPLPILFRRTPYGVPDAAPTTVPTNLKELWRTGTSSSSRICAGASSRRATFKLSSQVNLADSKSTNETTDAYDSIDWLVKNVAEQQRQGRDVRRVVRRTHAALALLHPHPALKAISEQASPVDQWMNDDDPPLRRAARELRVRVRGVRAGGQEQEHALRLRDLRQLFVVSRRSVRCRTSTRSTCTARFHTGTTSSRIRTTTSSGRRRRGSTSSMRRRFRTSTSPDSGIRKIRGDRGRSSVTRREHDPDHTNFMVAGPWYHGGWHTPKGDSIGAHGARRTRDRARVPRERSRRRSSATICTARARSRRGTRTTFQSGSNTWRTYAAWPPKEAKPTNLYLHADGTLSFAKPSRTRARTAYREYVSDPANPVPYRQRPISPTYPDGDWRTMGGRRPAIRGRSSRCAHLHERAARSRSHDHGRGRRGSVRVDVRHRRGFHRQVDRRLSGERDSRTRGTRRPVPRRGQYAQISERLRAADRDGGAPRTLQHELRTSDARSRPNAPVEWKIPLRDRDHVFLKGHRLMVQVQSTWFPLIDRNPQKFVPSIYKATASDYVKATQRVYSTAERSSHIVLPVMP